MGRVPEMAELVKLEQNLTVVAMATVFSNMRCSLLLLLLASSPTGNCFSLGYVGLQRRTSTSAQVHANRLPRLSLSATSPVSSGADSQVEQASRDAFLNCLGQHNTTVSFPTYSELMLLRPGECVLSDTISVASADDNKREFQFRVKLYPRGGGHKAQHTVLNKKKEKSGFGMSYRVLPMFGGKEEEKVGVYLEFLPNDEKDTVDASFGLRMIGQQRGGRKFDVEWRSGMRFVALWESQLREGRANDFGAHLMQTSLLPSFLGVDDEDDDESPVQVQVSITLHDRPVIKAGVSTKDILGQEVQRDESVFSSGFGVFTPRDLRDGSSAFQSSGSTGTHDIEQVRVGRVVVPVLRGLSQRPRMFAAGTYPGVEYRILRITDPSTGQDLFYSRPGAEYDLKPIYPLVRELERPWPVTVNEKDIPKLFTPAMYNIVSAVGSLLTAVTGLVLALAVSQAVSIFFIPSRSMDPTLQVGDVLLVDKVTPRLAGLNHDKGDVVLFHPPQRLQDIVARSGGRTITDRDLFVKRIAATTGDRVTVDSSGGVKVNDRVDGNRDLCTAEPLRLIEKYVEPSTYVVPDDSVVVLGDCSSVSVDSRVWGPLASSEIVGRPLLRLWPLERFGDIPKLPTADFDSWSDK